MNRLLGYLVTFLLVFGLIDGVFRLTGCSPQPVRVEFHDTRGWQNKKSTDETSKGKEFNVDVSFNSLGMRGPEVAEAKAPDTKRILFVGDSFTLGYTVEDRATFVRLVEEQLKQNGHKIEVLNGGTEAYSTDQELLWLQEVGAKLKPDYVVLSPYLNDIYWNLKPQYMHRTKGQFERDGDGVKLVSGTLADPGEKPWFKRHTGVGTFADKLSMIPLVKQHQFNHNGSACLLEDAPLLANPPREIDQAWEITEAILNEFARETQAIGAKPIALLVANRWEIETDAAPPQTLPGVERNDMTPSAPTDHFKAACDKAGFDVIDPRGPLKAAAANHSVYFKHDWHWNEAGNRVVASVLVNHFEQPNLLGPGDGSVDAESLATFDDDDDAKAGIPTWAIIVSILWLLLGIGYGRTYPNENPIVAFLKVGLLIAFVASVVIGVGKLSTAMPAAFGKWLTPALILGLLGFILVKTAKQFSVISELYGTFLRRGHWYLLPMLVVMLSIGMLLVVAASSPFVAPFIYTLF